MRRTRKTFEQKVFDHISEMKPEIKAKNTRKKVK